MNKIVSMNQEEAVAFRDVLITEAMSNVLGAARLFTSAFVGADDSVVSYISHEALSSFIELIANVTNRSYHDIFIEIKACTRGKNNGNSD